MALHDDKGHTRPAQYEGSQAENPQLRRMARQDEGDEGKTQDDIEDQAQDHQALLNDHGGGGFLPGDTTILEPNDLIGLSPQ